MVESTYVLPGCIRNHDGQGLVYLALPDGPLLEGIPLVVGLHGSGRDSLSYREIPFYRRQRDMALWSGCPFASVSNGPDAWGLDDGLVNLVLLLDDVGRRHPIGSSCVLWATSAGGVLMHRMVKEHPASVRLAIGTFPVYDLLCSFPRSAGCGRAWKASNLEELAERTTGRNPPGFVENLVGHEYLIGHGAGDSVVPIRENSIRFRDEANALGGQVRLMESGGGHSIENYAVYGHGELEEALRRHAAGRKTCIRR